MVITLSRQVDEDEWVAVGRGETDADGRCRTLLGDRELEVGAYAIRFETGDYFHSMRVEALYPFVEIVFRVRDAEGHYHIPLLLTANGYTTYRGS